MLGLHVRSLVMILTRLGWAIMAAQLLHMEGEDDVAHH